MRRATKPTAAQATRTQPPLLLAAISSHTPHPSLASPVAPNRIRHLQGLPRNRTTASQPTHARRSSVDPKLPAVISTIIIMTTPVPPKLELGEVTEMSISVRFAAPAAGVASYVLQWKEHPANWEGAGSAPVPAGVTEADAAPLQPGATYCVRLVPVHPDGTQGTPGPELVVDTEAIGCTPNQKSSCCTVL